MDGTEVLSDGIGRIRDEVEQFGDLDADALAQAPSEGANPIGWILWHLTRVQDAHVAELVDGEQLWTEADFAGRLGLTADPADTGYGHSTDDVAAVRITDAEVLVEYHRAVAERTLAFLRAVDDAILDRVVDESYDPPVTLGVRMTSVVVDSLEHLGQAAYVRGLIGR